MNRSATYSATDSRLVSMRVAARGLLSAPVGFKVPA